MKFQLNILCRPGAASVEVETLPPSARLLAELRAAGGEAYAFTVDLPWILTTAGLEPRGGAADPGDEGPPHPLIEAVAGQWIGHVRRVLDDARAHVDRAVAAAGAGYEDAAVIVALSAFLWVGERLHGMPWRVLSDWALGSLEAGRQTAQLSVIAEGAPDRAPTEL